MLRKLRNTRQFTRTTGWVFGWVLGLFAVGLLAPAALAADADHLIISEFMVKTRNPVSTFGSPFIEVDNPTAVDLDMSHVYLTDATFSPSTFYYNLTLKDPEVSNPGGGNGGDFHAKFPDGFVLGAGQSLVIAINGSAQFFEAYGRQPDFELFEDAAMPDAVADLVEAFPGSINAGPLGGGNIPILSDVAETLVLYQWDGQTDLVQDLDYVVWGTNTGVRVDKTGVTIGAGTYLADTPVGDQDIVATAGPNFAHSFQRVSIDEGSEFVVGGNGIDGHDETSEDFSATWADVTPADPAAGLPEAFPSAPVVTSLAPGDAIEGIDVTLRATALTFGALTGIDFYYSIEGGDYLSLAGQFNEEGGFWEVAIGDHPVATQVSYYCVATNDGGGVAAYPAGAPVIGARSLTVKRAPDKLLITEVSAGENIFPTFTGMEQIAKEFIEIHNPSDIEVDLSDYYLTDAIHYDSTQLYWYIAQGNPTQGTVGGGNYNDFTARFPEGYTIEPFGTITVSLAGSSWFELAFGILPDLEMYEEGAEPDSIPDMRPVFVNPASDLPGNSIYTPDRSSGSDGLPRGIPELEEHYGEPVILYHYLEGENLVTDIDIFLYGPPESKEGPYRFSFDKTGSSNGGSTYKPDTPVADQQWFDPVDETGWTSYTRIDREEGTQSQVVGNGVANRDETSENLNQTFKTLTFTPGYFLAGYSGEQNPITLRVPAKTFNPYLGEEFPIEMVCWDRAETRLRVFDLEGRLVDTLFDSRFDGPASNFKDYPSLVYWDGLSDTFERVPAGMYVLHLSVINPATGEESIKTVPVVVATRLSN